MSVLIGHLKAVVENQFSELRRSLAGLGDLQLTPAFVRHQTTQLRWNAMSETAKTKAFDSLMKDNGMTNFFSFQMYLRAVLIN